ncbi:MAG: competence/damage-inducible protein A [Ignavibacteriales bacterium]|nr:MAG: competence/damage-inducible protein A [Ignavibacteriaceae bacterium]MBW7872423.1 competence/damage-inducible protein A [Ignavibacteria bacterium]MCZ2143641.1 competence/damage-inducible protein A [Ignavibacteriales bacterium]OQY74896.1 MAG: competence/damage-inducible protein A [Ignavibacteriales bacterium UTCHB3]MBV6445429.1 Nicotinamide-nucleotide amidohydrolase PncC [Ignavibacteriaceae bacterium]
MRAQIISIGDELLIGQTVNTNASFIGSRLAEIGVEVNKIVTTSDNLHAIHEDLRNALKAVNLVIVTGGLGPTHDDITRDAICSFYNCELREDEDVLNDIRERFRRFGRELTPTNLDQAKVPACCEPIRNPNGTAPGFWIKHEGQIVAVMPGVPREMKAMMENFVIPNIRLNFGTELKNVHRINLLTTGIAESNLFDKLNPIDDVLPDVKVAFLPNLSGVKIRITGEGATPEEARTKADAATQQIKLRVGRYVYGEGDVDQAEIIAKILKERQLTVATAESCTGGHIADMLTDIPGSSEYFERGVVSYSNASKVEILQVDEDLIQDKGAVSSEVAEQMAKGVRSISGSDLGLSITGILGPKGATPNKPVGLVFIGVASFDKAVVKQFNFGGNRYENKIRAAHAALEILRRFILGISIET